jgi:hypothetical protein
MQRERKRERETGFDNMLSLPRSEWPDANCSIPSNNLKQHNNVTHVISLFFFFHIDMESGLAHNREK